MKKLHWTKRPENKERLRELGKKSAQTRKAKAKVSSPKLSAGRAQLIAYAKLGAEVTINRCRAELVTAQMFINSFKQ